MRLRFWRREDREVELEEEIRGHLRMAARDRFERGEAPEQARVSARREFGNVGLVKEVTREMWGRGSLERLGQDLRFGVRMLLKQPGFSLIAVLTLGLGIGANTAIFSLIHTMLIQPLPYPDAGRVLLAMGWDVRRDQTRFQVSAADFQDWRDECSAFEQAAGYLYWSVNLTGAGEPERVQGC